MSFAYYNEKFGNYDDIKIPLSDRSIFFGDGVYDAAIGKGGKIYLEDEHIERFVSNAEKLALPKTDERVVSQILNETVRRSGISDFFLYFQLSGFADERRHAPRNTEKCNFLVTVKPYSPPPPSKELSLILFPDKRQSFCNIKTLNLLGSVMAAEASAAANADEAVLVRGERVTECAHSNIFIVKDGVLMTHPKDEKILPGITRKKLLEFAEKIGVRCIETPFSTSELFAADDVIVTSTTKLAMRANFANGIEISRKKCAAADKLIALMRKDFDDFC